MSPRLTPGYAWNLITRFHTGPAWREYERPGPHQLFRIDRIAGAGVRRGRRPCGQPDYSGRTHRAQGVPLRDGE
jgi:hypothetical protein